MKAKRWREIKYNATAALRRPRGELREMGDLRRQRKIMLKLSYKSTFKFKFKFNANNMGEPGAHDKVLDSNPDRTGIWKC